MKRTHIAYHGTNATNAQRIRREGFRAGTYFASHLEDAIDYGGLWVFEVAIPGHLIPKSSWQFTLGTQVLPEFIIRLTRYKASKIVYDNLVLRHMTCISNCSKATVDYTRRHMESHPNRYSADELTAYGVSLPVSPQKGMATPKSNKSQ